MSFLIDWNNILENCDATIFIFHPKIASFFCELWVFFRRMSFDFYNPVIICKNFVLFPILKVDEFSMRWYIIDFEIQQFSKWISILIFPRILNCFVIYPQNLPTPFSFLFVLPSGILAIGPRQWSAFTLLTANSRAYLPTRADRLVWNIWPILN